MYLSALLELSVASRGISGCTPRRGMPARPPANLGKNYGSLVDGALVWKQMPEEESGIEHDFYLICPVTAVRAAAPLHCTRMKMPKHAHVCLARIHVSVRMHVADDCAR